MINVDVLVKNPIYPLFVIPAPYQVRGKLQKESSDFRLLWTPAFAGVTRFLTFYEVVNVQYRKNRDQYY
jgi:hypothetical protein